jgi:hypothetical protein
MTIYYLALSISIIILLGQVLQQSRMITYGVAINSTMVKLTL